jgi:hypothetical protein
MSLRRSARNAGKAVNYIEESRLFPEEPPSNDFEHLIHDLNLQAFPSLSYARVDDILVFALFATKRCHGHYRSLVPATSGERLTITMEVAISIANIIRLGVSCENPTMNECQATAMQLRSTHHNLFLMDDLSILEQYVLFFHILQHLMFSVFYFATAL